MGIVTVNVSQTIAPAPSQLQKTGAFISQGGTTLSAGTRALLQSSADLTALLQPAKAITSLAWSGSVVTVTTAAPHGLTNGDTLPVTIAGATPSGYNGSYTATVTGASTFTYPLVSNPGSETIPGTYILNDVAELISMNSTFFAQGSQQAVYVLELGPGTPAEGVTALGTYITANPGVFYAYLVPALWSGEATFKTFAALFTALTAKTYFYTLMTLGNYAGFANTLKSVFGEVPAPATPATEFTVAAAFFKALNYKPSSTNKVTPMAYSYQFGVTPYPTAGNVSTLASLLAANVNYVGTGAEGGLSNLVLFNGTTKDGRDFSYWYSVDWAAINIDTNVAAAVINGSNNPQNPLYYNQDGINRLQAVIASTMATGVTYGMVFGTPIQVQMDPSDFTTAVQNGQFAGLTAINAQPFLAYSAANPNDYAAGLYSGFQVAFTPNRGFKQIVIGVNVSDFITS